jgi:hypothetical protein
VTLSEYHTKRIREEILGQRSWTTFIRRIT